MSQFQFGAHAIFTRTTEAEFRARRHGILTAIQPQNVIEELLTEELVHASWDMERARNANADTARHDRASRTWHRSLKQLKKLQSARASHIAELFEPAQRRVAAQCPLADLAKLPKPLLVPETPEVQ